MCGIDIKVSYWRHCSTAT